MVSVPKPWFESTRFESTWVERLCFTPGFVTEGILALAFLAVLR